MDKNTQDETRKELARIVDSLSQNLLKLSTIISKPANENERKLKKPKDKNKPKQALSSYMYYSLANRERVISKHPGIKFTEISTILGKEWRSLNEEQKNLWKDYADKDKERYKKEIEKYNNNLISQSNKEEIQEPEKKKPRKELKEQNQKHSNNNLISQPNKKQIEELEKKKPRKELKEQNQNKQKPTASSNEVKSDVMKKKKVTFNNPKDLKYKTIGTIQSKKLAKVAKRKARKNKIQQFIVTDRN